MHRVRNTASALLLSAAIVALSGSGCYAQGATTTASGLVELRLTDNSKIIGEIIEDAQDSVTVRTSAGLRIAIPRSVITSIKPATGHVSGGRYFGKDPNYSRLLFAPTGRPLKKGDGYLIDTYVLLPGIAYGLTDQVSILVGFSIVPGLDFNDQVLYVIPKFGIELSDKAAVSVGALYASFWDDVSAGIVYTVGTVGEHDRSLHGGLGLGFTRESERGFEFAKRPVFLIGGNLRLTNGIALVGECWPIPSTASGEMIIPVAVAVRFLGENLAVDVGMVIEKHVIAEGFPIPWLNAAYNFRM